VPRKQSRYKLINGQRHKSCTRCDGYFPADEEFFYQQEGRLSCWCKACDAEQRQETWSTTPCCVEGCNEDRHQGPSGRWYGYCTKHYRETTRRYNRKHAKKHKREVTS